MSQPLVSVVIPIYNVEKYLDRCITSVVNQTYGNLEIILVDDGSPDNCPAMCDEWAQRDKRIKTVHKPNEGAGLSRNAGIDNASGDYVLFVDSDDYIDLSAAEKCVETLRKNNSDVVMFGRVEVKSNGETKSKPIVTDKYYFVGEEVLHDVLPGLFISEKGFGVGVCGKMFNLAKIKENGIRFRSEREILSEDACFLLELFKHIGSVSLLDENFYYYFQNENSFSRTYKKNLPEMNDRFLNCCINLCEKCGYPEKTVSYIKARYHIYALTGMKQLFVSDIPFKEKRRLLLQLHGNKTLTDSITDDVLGLANRNSRIFWKLFRNKCFGICYLMLFYKAH